MTSLAELIANGPPSGEDENAPKPIGGFVGPQSGGAAFNAQYGEAARAERAAAEARGEVWQPTPQTIYFEGDERVPASFAVEDIAALQKGLAAAGLLSGKFRLGLWDKPSRSAFTELLGFANQQGMEWSQALNVYSSSEQMGGDDTEPTYTREQFLPRDPAEWRNAAQTMANSLLGRELTAEEANRLAETMRGFEQQQHDIMQDAQAAQFDAQSQGMAEVPAEPVEQVDPAARLQEEFTEEFRPEMEFRDRQADTGATGGLLAQILGRTREGVNV